MRIVQDHIDAFTARTGYRRTNAPRYKALMEAAGFVGVVAMQYRWPSNPEWVMKAAPSRPGSARDDTEAREKGIELGRLFLHQYDVEMLENACARIFLKGVGWSRERLDELLARVDKELRDPDIRAFSPM